MAGSFFPFPTCSRPRFSIWTRARRHLHFTTNIRTHFHHPPTTLIHHLHPSSSISHPLHHQHGIFSSAPSPSRQPPPPPPTRARWPRNECNGHTAQAHRPPRQLWPPPIVHSLLSRHTSAVGCICPPPFPFPFPCTRPPIHRGLASSSPPHPPCAHATVSTHKLRRLGSPGCYPTGDTAVGNGKSTASGLAGPAPHSMLLEGRMRD
jgi:hypothetical protein